MRLLRRDDDDEISLTKYTVGGNVPSYVILSHTWGLDGEEVTFQDFMNRTEKDKAGYEKIRFCANQARQDGFSYFWVDTCCIDKTNSTELSEAINSMFRWYREAARCYVYLSDVVATSHEQGSPLPSSSWDSAFRLSKWFTRGWTLQELVAPESVQFFARDGMLLGDKTSLQQQIHGITGIPIEVLQGTPLARFNIEERFKWAEGRQTTREEDWAYSLLGIFGVFISPIYGEGRGNAIRRLKREIKDALLTGEMQDPASFSTETPELIRGSDVLEQPEAQPSHGQGQAGNSAQLMKWPEVQLMETENRVSGRVPGEDPSPATASILPLRLLGRKNGKFFVFEPRSSEVNHFDLISNRCGNLVAPHLVSIDGLDWAVTISRQELTEIQGLFVSSGVQYMWVGSLCINQYDQSEVAAEVSKISEYFRNARMCHIMIDTHEVWNPKDTLDNLKFIDHVTSHMHGVTLASEAPSLTENDNIRLSAWANKDWTFGVDKSTAKSAGIDIGVLSCYSTCINHVRSLFENPYFSSVWTFREMILGKNITVWAINHENISCIGIGGLPVLIDLVTHALDKTHKLQQWMLESRGINNESVSAILRMIEEDRQSLDNLRIQLQGISSARIDIMYGGRNWWHQNYEGISNIFSVYSIGPRLAPYEGSIFEGLLEIFDGLFTPEEVKRELSGDDIETISFNFFKQLSIKTGHAWTRLAVNSGERDEWNWIPVAKRKSVNRNTDFFAGIIRLGRLAEKGKAGATAVTGITGVPQKYIQITLGQAPDTDFHFVFKGCNCGKAVKTSFFSRKPIPTDDQPTNVAGDETARVLVQCATILGSFLDPGRDVVEYRRRLLSKLQPEWYSSNFNTKSTGWIDRCVSGTAWENPVLRAHNLSMNYRMVDLSSCGSRLSTESTAGISCEVLVNCGCTIIAPFPLIFEAIIAMEGCFLGDTFKTLGRDNRVVLRDGLGSLPIGDEGKTFNLVAFGGDIDSHKSFSTSCRTTRVGRPVVPMFLWPSGRALLSEEATHDMENKKKDYGYVETGGPGNLLICRNHPSDQYRIVGVCLDDVIPNKKGRRTVTIR